MHSLQYPIRKIGDYIYSLKEAALGQTDKCSVFGGYSLLTEKPVAIKFIKKQQLTNADKDKFLLNQIDTMHTLRNCQNIVEVYDVYETEDDNIFIVMEKCSNDLLSVIEKENGNGISQRKAMSYMNQILNGYKAIYQNNIIHRDLKPQNIFLNDNLIKIGDFGYAIKGSLKYSDGLITTSENVGSPYYMSPQSLSKSIYSFKSDIWSLGMIYYEMIIGNLPWVSDNQSSLQKQIKQFDIEQYLIEDMLQESKQFLRKTLCRNVNQRMSAQEIIQFRFNEVKIKKNKTDKDNLKIKYKKISSCQQYKLQLQSFDLKKIQNSKYLGISKNHILNNSQDRTVSSNSLSPIKKKNYNQKNLQNQKNPQNQIESPKKFQSLRFI